MPTVHKTQGPVVPTKPSTSTSQQASTAQPAAEPTSPGYSSQSQFESPEDQTAKAKKFVDDNFMQMMFDQMNARYKSQMEEARRNWEEE